MFKVAVRLVADAGLIAVMLFTAAGTVTWWRGWALLAVMLVIRVIGAAAIYRVSPGLLAERAKLPIHRDQPWTDRVLLLGVLLTGFLGLPVIAALDVLHMSSRPPALLGAIGLVLFAAGWIIKNLALHANAFATVVLRLQRERGHAVAETGVYGIVRHPFYAADPLIHVGLALWLGSYVAFLAALIPVSLMVIRLQLEERFLRRELPGYEAYTHRVPHRLIPGIW